MNCLNEFLANWWKNDNCFTRNYILDNLINLVDYEPLWDIDRLSYEIYKKDVRKLQKRYKVSSLDYKEEQRLIKLKCNGDSEAFQKLVFSQLPYVMHIASKYQNLGLPLNDLISEGNIGLIEAIRKIEPRGFRVTSFTIWYVKERIQNAINKYGMQIYYPSNIISSINKVKNIINKFELQNGYQPSEEEIAEICNIQISSVEDILLCINSEISIEQLYRCIDEINDLDVFINSSCNPHFNFAPKTADDELYKESLGVDMDSVLRKLYDRERKILEMYFGIGGKEMKLEEIAYKLNVTRERVRQIKERAIRRMKGNKSKVLRQYLG